MPASRLLLHLGALTVALLLVTLSTCAGSPCTDNTHDCQTDSQRCVERNNTAGFTCECVRIDQQLDDKNNCTDIPDSQRLYLTTPINTTGADIYLVFQILKDPKYSEEALRGMYRDLTVIVPSYKAVKFIEYRVGPVPDFRITVYTLLFTDNITMEIRQAVARSVLLVEEVGQVSTHNITVTIAGHTGIFDTEADTRGEVDAVDWCSSPSLYSCRENSTCRDVKLRYDCPCDAGFVDDGKSCYVCDDNFHYGPNCALPCNCVINNTKSCDHVNGTCFCKDSWEGVTCDIDADECTKNPGICGDPFKRCLNTEGGYQCVCTDTSVFDEASGTCFGAIITGQSPFDTGGSRYLDLRCEASNETEVTQYTWSDACLQKEEDRCTIRPQPPWDDGKNITCTVNHKNGLSATATFQIDLNYPPPSSPVIEGYVTGVTMRAGETLEMTCSVPGGKPLVTSVNFSCPHHPDRTPDIIEASIVTSDLEIKLKSSDDGALCVCSALWKSSAWYPKISTRVLVVMGTVEAAAKESPDILDLKWYIVFGVLGFLMVVLVIVVVVICRNRASSTRDGNATPSTEMSSAGTTVTGMGTTLIGMEPPMPHRTKLPPLGTGQDGTTDLNQWPVTHRNVWRPFPGISMESVNTVGMDRGSVTAESGTYDVLTHIESGPVPDLYLRPVPPSHHTPPTSRRDADFRPKGVRQDAGFRTAGGRQDADFRIAGAFNDTEFRPRERLSDLW